MGQVSPPSSVCVDSINQNMVEFPHHIYHYGSSAPGSSSHLHTQHLGTGPRLEAGAIRSLSKGKLGKSTPERNSFLLTSPQKERNDLTNRVKHPSPEAAAASLGQPQLC